VLVVASISEDGETGTIKVARVTHEAIYDVDGFNRTWVFGYDEDMETGYMFRMEPDGKGLYYDFRASNGAATRPSMLFSCQEKALERQNVIEREREIERQRAVNSSEMAAYQFALQQKVLRNWARPEMAAYQFALQQKVLRNWARPSSAKAGLDCLVQVRQSATGEVISARVVSCNGDAAVERSIEAAVYKASPLPLPENRVMFDPNIRFRFMPE
jgi:hypothetical protein